MPQPIYFRKDRKGFPLASSNVRANRRPSTAHIPIENVFVGPIPDFEKVRFQGANRYFVQFNETTGQIVPNSLVVSTTVPTGYYLEVFSNNIIALPIGDTQESGVIIEDVNKMIEDKEIEPIMIYSEDYAQNGYRK